MAAIVSPYCRGSPSPQSTLTWFRVEHPLGRLPSGVYTQTQADICVHGITLGEYVDLAKIRIRQHHADVGAGCCEGTIDLAVCFCCQPRIRGRWVASRCGWWCSCGVSPSNDRQTTPCSHTFKLAWVLLLPVADPMAVGCKPVRVAVQLEDSPTEDAHAQALPAAELPALAQRYATKVILTPEAELVPQGCGF